MTAHVDLGVGDSHTVGPTAGQMIAGRYRIRSLLGVGGMGRVWLAHDELLDRPVALKQEVVDGPLSEQCQREARMRALAEARAAARVKHDGAVAVYDIARDGGRPWIVMEPLTGETLAQRLKSGASLSINEVSRLALRLLDVLQAIHEAGIIHRDVKPANVQLCPDDRIVLTDFGIASIAGEDPLGTLAGSPSYVSPEQLRGDKPEPTADLFSLGATLFAAVEGRPPFGDGDLHATLAATMLGDRAPMLRAGPLRPVIAGLLAREPHDRPSPAAVREMLLECISGRRHRPDEMADGVGREWRDDTSDRTLPWSELTGPVPAAEDDRRTRVAIRRRSPPPIVPRRDPTSAEPAHRIVSTRRSGQWLQVSRRLPG